MNIFLIGYRCTGKTSVGRKLSGNLEKTFIDADIKLVEDYGAAIKDIVEREGWASFRAKEKEVLKTLCLSENQVIATGGGVIIDYENVEIMKKNGHVIWLKATVETIRNRIFSDQMTEEQRPSLTSKGLENEIEETLSERNPLYTNAMDFSIDTDNVSIDLICSEIMEKMKRFER